MSNIMLWSQEFENAVWQYNEATPPSGGTVVAPDGTLTAEAIFPADAATDSWFSQDVNLTANVPYIFSIFLKVPTGTKDFYIFAGGGSGPDFGGNNFQPTLISGWGRYSVGFTPNSNQTNGFFQVGGATKWSSGEVDCWGAQLEQSDVLTVYNTTTSAPFIASTVSPVDSRDYGNFPNSPLNFNGQNGLLYTIPSVDSRTAGAPVDSRAAGAPVDSRNPFNVTQNSRT